MKNQNKFSIQEKIKSLKYALNGLKIFIKQEHNSWLYLIMIFLSTGFGIYFEISRYEWFFQIILIIVVLVAELFNSSIESVIDLISPQFHPLAKKAKDLASSAILIIIIGILLLFFMIYLPKFFY